uniref:Ig-like domain-containing protein n=1 Tax=Sander lucioperca TaxID=283035 RepID=A0A8D0DHE6_SANLU
GFLKFVKLNVTPKITAECGKQVTLTCNVSSSRHGLSIKHMNWSQKNRSFCSVDSEGNISHHMHTLSHFHCEYKHGQLSLIFKRVQPLESGDYRCKLQSNQGAKHQYTRVELQGQCPQPFLFRQTVICLNTILLGCTNKESLILRLVLISLAKLGKLCT